MLDLLRKSGPFEVRRNISLPEGQKSLRAISPYCGSVAVESFTGHWEALQAMLPQVEGLPAPLIEPNQVVLAHEPEIEEVLRMLAYDTAKDKATRLQRMSVMHTLKRAINYTRIH